MACFHCRHLANCGSHSGPGLAGELPSYWEFVLKRTERRVKADGGESTRRNKKQGQETQEYKTSLSDDDLKNLAGGLALAEYLAIPAAVVVSDRNSWAGELGARHLVRRTRNDTGQSEQIRPTLGWLCQVLRAAVALTSAAAFCAIVSQLFVLLAHVVEAHL